jgi:hypothetical protein
VIGKAQKLLKARPVMLSNLQKSAHGKGTTSARPPALAVNAPSGMVAFTARSVVEDS